ncbi:geraniol 8-hydroxylase-like [Triticum dicoccoides]|uniref:geraniol 8-hydroxylase-like n=1 Tax=Triticum dicoccoides TaxID=85692 RepID=UPI00188F2B25|nr:geraniol 8-hydroxylase-like [Triticum dicoccoides]
MVALAVLAPWLAWLVVSVLSFYFLNLLAHARSGLPPGPRPLPLIGSLHLLGDKPHRSLARLAKIHGPLMSIRLGAVTTVVVSSPAMAREFLQRHDSVLAIRSVPDATGKHAAGVAWLSPGPRWRALRKIMATELFAPHRLDALHHLRSGKVRELTDHVARLAREGTAVNVGRVAFTTSLNLISRTIFSIDLTSLDDHGGSEDFQEVITAMMEGLGTPNVSDFFPVLAPADLQGMRRRLARIFARLHAVFDAEVDKRLRGRDAGQPRKNDYLDVLLDVAARDEGKDLLDRDTLRSQFTDLFAAGSDTSSSTVEWAMAELLRNPSSMVKVCDELAQVIGSRRNIEEADIVRLPYLQAVIKETFRLHPPAPLLLPRQPETTVKIAGYTIPKGSRVFINVWAIGRDKDVWTEPEMFMPERFLGSAIDFRGVDFELLPFGAGRRICPGMTLAIRMVHVMLASLLNQFKWSLPIELERDGIDMQDHFGLTLAKNVPLCIIATPISGK